MDLEIARANMIDQQIRPWNVLEMQTLEALGRIRREDFVPVAYKALAFVDAQIPLMEDEVMLEPKVSARMMEALHLGPDDRVLEIGTGSGYVTALMASICDHVTSLEIHAELMNQAESNLKEAGIHNYRLIHKDCHKDWDQLGEFDAVFISGSCKSIADSFLGRLSGSTRVVGIEGDAPAMQAVLYRMDNGNETRSTLFETWAPRLKNTEDRPEFIF